MPNPTITSQQLDDVAKALPKEEKVAFGIASKVGYFLTAAGFAVTTAIASGAHLGLSTKNAAAFTVIAGVGTNLGRQLQRFK